jgi:hypothetical protein
VAVNADRIPTSATVNQNRIDRAGNVVANQASTTIQGVPNGTYGFQQSFSQTTPPPALGQNRPAVALTGFAGGIMETRDPSGNVLPPGLFVGGASVQLDPGDSRVQARLVGPVLYPNDEPPGGAAVDGSFQFGSVDRTQPARGTYIDYENFGARGAVERSGGSPQPTALINGGPVDSQNLVFSSAGTPAVRTALQNAFPSVNFCQCEYTRWGFWSASTQQGGFYDGVHMGTWVAGQIPSTPQVPTVGTATYSGHVVASVRNGASQYIAAGNLASTINFGSPTASTAQVTGFDGRNYSGPLVISATGIGGALTSGGPSPHTLGMAGSFFRGAMHQTVGEMGGSVLINPQTASSYTGSGIFAARMTGATGLGP